MTALDKFVVGAVTAPDEHPLPPAVRPLLLPIPSTGQTLGIGRSTVYELAAAGDIEIVRIGRRALVTVASIEAYVERLRAPSMSDDAGSAA